ncbi:glycosyl hydrolase family 18 [Microbacterium sp. cx-55]|uniref:chitinase n=1 Tax=Microbacterium sp. cx-55 TaxID=2875948 RepID=UPI001CBBB373|nr:carbohydrate-binding protein [Microbacterium sp. cx-55]MBZ4487734.1 glycosyl hydrolase family 18 [Microbacterium sp. cx-55]UGB34855.1 glycosyl hydrolase family 18 [Microbacterium sp. cx-55]
MSRIRPATVSRFAGRRLSLPRLAASIVGMIVASASVFAAVVMPQLAPPISGAAAAQQWFAGYYDVTLESAEQLARSALEQTTGGAVLAFVVAAGDDDCTPTWGKAYTLDDAARLFELDRRVERMHREGTPVAVSFGGAINTELAAACADAESLAGAYRTVLDRYRLDVIDLDIEGDLLADTAATARRAAAVAALQAERRADDRPLDVWLTLPIAPYGLTPEGIEQVDALLSAGVEVAGVNGMTMNYGTDGTVASMSALSIDALTALAPQLADAWDRHAVDLPPGGVWSLIGATPMIGRNDVAGEVFTLDDARALNAFAKEHGVARMSMWSLNRDQTCGSNYPHPTVVSTGCSGIEQGGERFAALLDDGYSGTPGGRALDEGDGDVIADDPKTSPYPVWSSQMFYSSAVKVVWNGSVYMSKWWNEDGPTPDDPTLDVAGSAWSYLGPVLDSDTPFTLPQLPAGTYPDWSVSTLYNQGDRVMLDGSGYEARWWSQGQRPDRSVLDRDYSPWKLITPP